MPYINIPYAQTLDPHTHHHSSLSTPNLQRTTIASRAEMEEDYAQLNPNAGAPSENCVRLFGVKLTDCNHHNVSHQMGIMRKSVSMGNLGLMGFNSLQRQLGCAQPHAEFGAAHPRSDGPQQGYSSDGLMQSSSCMNLRERKKGVPWTEDEHRLFLAGLQKLGKGDWRGISRNFVTSRTPTQVASHAQKYFLRQGNLNKRKRRSSLFDINNLVPGTNVIGDNSQTFGAMERVRPPLELGSQQGTASSSSLLYSLSPYSKPPSSATPSVCADLCLGSSHLPEWQVSAENVSSMLSQSRKQGIMMDALPPTQLLSSNKNLGLDDAMRINCKNKSIYTISSSSSSSKSISSSASLCRIDEMSELSSLSLSIGPPMSMEASELALKLEQPVTTSKLSVSPSAKVSELKEVLLMAGNGNKVTSMANAIRVV